ncbi:MAG: XdhC family protein [Gemmatimonadota bacterium]|nr:XdhC family protein [Gemmatimonadota bacterium]MDE2784575.1 XdhC family protein [Gemmatimonadota bacterium]MDE2864378.1 XdhC family protein [Gemmatimonadota bacterium]MYB05389.1 xanthine dehydrogenase [Gemmatimonadota bacterium]MYG22852.1 xanthine dehydrogenase [Gemmatimonadota bacterium]
MNADVLRAVVAAQVAGRDLVLATRLTDGVQAVIETGSPTSALGLDGDAVASALRTGEPRTVDTPDGAVFLRPYIRPPRLIVVGAVHIAQALVPMAQIAGFEVTVLDPREGFATADRFPGAELVKEWPDRVMETLRPDDRTGVVALTHDPKIDDPALIAAIESNAFYIGALGSRKTQGARRERLGALGFAAADLERIHGPVGLPIGARTPEEIAVAVLAQVIGALRL